MCILRCVVGGGGSPSFFANKIYYLLMHSAHVYKSETFANRQLTQQWGVTRWNWQENICMGSFHLQHRLMPSSLGIIVSVILRWRGRRAHLTYLSDTPSAILARANKCIWSSHEGNFNSLTNQQLLLIDEGVVGNMNVLLLGSSVIIFGQAIIQFSSIHQRSQCH